MVTPDFEQMFDRVMLHERKVGPILGFHHYDKMSLLGSLLAEVSRRERPLLNQGICLDEQHSETKELNAVGKDKQREQFLGLQHSPEQSY